MLSGGAESSEWKAWSGELRETLVLILSRESEAVGQRLQSELGIKRVQPLWIRELSTAGSTACQQTLSTPEEQMTMAIQQLNVQLQQFQETLATILQAARNELVKQVQSATSTTTHEEPMKRADRLFKLRSYLGDVDQRNELESATTEESSTPRLNRMLSTQMYYILVMTKTLYKCRDASASEEFAGRRQFVREWEPRFVGLLRNVLSCRCKDDIPTQLPVDEVLTQESQLLEAVIDDVMMYANVLRIKDGRVEACFIWESTGIANSV